MATITERLLRTSRGHFMRPCQWNLGLAEPLRALDLSASFSERPPSSLMPSSGEVQGWAWTYAACFLWNSTLDRLPLVHEVLKQMHIWGVEDSTCVDPGFSLLAVSAVVFCFITSSPAVFLTAWAYF
jgi:hypothetical protein